MVRAVETADLHRSALARSSGVRAGPARKAAPEVPYRSTPFRGAGCTAGRGPSALCIGVRGLAAAAACRASVQRPCLRPQRRTSRLQVHQARVQEANRPEAEGNCAVTQQRRRVENFKEFLLMNEKLQPLWYRLSDLYLTFTGAFAFYLIVCEPQVAFKYRLSDVLDFINVNFVIRFVLLFWANDFQLSWLWSVKALLDLLSCLPVLGIPARFLGGQQAFEIFEIARFLRLLRLSISSEAGAGVFGSRRDPLQIVTVLIALGGTIILSATLLFLYENYDQKAGAESPFMSFEDSVLYMVNLFANKDTPFSAQTSGGKQVTVAATLVGAIFFPFLISGGVQVIMGSNNPFMNRGEATAPPSSTGWQQEAPTERGASVGGPMEWAGVLQRLDKLEGERLLEPQEAKELRKRCKAGDSWALTLDLCYGQEYLESTDGAAGRLYASRLREWLDEEGTD